MGGERSTALTARQREWLGHLRRASSGRMTVRAYARRHRLSANALYQAARALRRKGAWTPSRRAEKTQARFVEVRATAAAPAVEAPSPWRARLPNGVVIEGAGDLAGALAMLAAL